MKNTSENLPLSFPKAWRQETKPHKFCPGCGHPLVLKALGWVIDELGLQDKMILGLDIGCSLLAWDFMEVDTMQTHHGRTIPVMVGYKLARPDRVALAYLGDGGAYAIGAQHLVNAAMRNDKVTVIVVNNTLYGMTGGQEAPTTLPGEITTTTPQGADNFYINGPEAIASGIAKPGAYIARAAVDNPLQLKVILKKAVVNQLEGKGFSFVEVLSMCPLNWRTDAKETLAFLQKMKQTFPLGEFTPTPISKKSVN